MRPPAKGAADRKNRPNGPSSTGSLKMKKLLTATLFAAMTALPAVAADLGGRVLEIGSDITYPPHEFVNDAGETVGFDVDVVAEICKKINCQPVWINTAWDGIFPALANGQFDMVVSGVTITEERDKIVDFSDPYIIVEQGILTRVSDAGVTIDDFKSGAKRLASQTGTTNATLGEELVGRDNLALFDAFTAYEQEFAGELAVTVKGLSSDPLGLVFQEGDALADAFNEGLAEIKADGTMDKLVLKWWAK
jgi:polar amino acid transport system substrate-binding protein